MNRSDQQHPTAQPADSDRRDAWDELLLRRVLQARVDEPSADERWSRLSRRITSYEQLRSVNQAMAQRGAEFRRNMLLSRPWPSLLPLFS